MTRIATLQDRIANGPLGDRLQQLTAQREAEERATAEERRQTEEAVRQHREAYDANAERERQDARRARVDAERNAKLEEIKDGYRGRYLAADPTATEHDFEAAWPALREEYRRRAAMDDPSEQTKRELAAALGLRGRAVSS